MVLRLKDKLFQKVGLVFKRSFKKGDYYRRFIFPTEKVWKCLRRFLDRLFVGTVSQHNCLPAHKIIELPADLYSFLGVCYANFSTLCSGTYGGDDMCLSHI